MLLINVNIIIIMVEHQDLYTCILRVESCIKKRVEFEIISSKWQYNDNWNKVMNRVQLLVNNLKYFRQIFWSISEDFLSKNLLGSERNQK